jgi:hypothetical protein
MDKKTSTIKKTKQAIKKPRGGIKKATRRTTAAAAPTSKQLADFLGVVITKPLTTAQIQKLLKALPGYVNVLDDAADQYAEDGDLLRVKDVSASALEDLKAKQRDLARREAVAHEVYRSVYEQRLAVDNDAMAMLRSITRRIAALSDDHPELRTNWKNVLDFMAQFSPPGKKPSAPTPPQ